MLKLGRRKSNRQRRRSVRVPMCNILPEVYVRKFRVLRRLRVGILFLSVGLLITIVLFAGLYHKVSSLRMEYKHVVNEYRKLNVEYSKLEPERKLFAKMKEYYQFTHKVARPSCTPVVILHAVGRCLYKEMPEGTRFHTVSFSLQGNNRVYNLKLFLGKESDILSILNRQVHKLSMLYRVVARVSDYGVQVIKVPLIVNGKKIEKTIEKISASVTIYENIRRRGGKI